MCSIGAQNSARPPGANWKSRGSTPMMVLGTPLKRIVFAYHILSSAEPFLPRGVAQDHGIGRGRQILASVEIAAEQWSDSQSTKKPVAYPCSLHRFRACGGAQHVAASREDVHRAENLVEPLPVEIVGIRKVGARKQRAALQHANQPVGIRIRQRLDQRGIHKAEDGHAGAMPRASIRTAVEVNPGFFVSWRRV